MKAHNNEVGLISASRSVKHHFSYFVFLPAAATADRGSAGRLQHRAERLHHVLRAAEEDLLQYPHQAGQAGQVRPHRPFEFSI